jgi:hypothetical protein
MAGADCVDECWLQTNPSPAEHRRFLHSVQVLVGPVRPLMAPQIVPEILYRVQFRRPWRQRHQRDVRRHHQRLRPVIARPVPDQRDVLVRGNGLREAVEELLRGVGVDVFGDQTLGLAGCRTDRREDVQTFEPALLRSPWPRTFVGPDRRQRAFLAEAGFVFEPDFNLFFGVPGGDFRDDLSRFFLNASCASGSASGCCGRGRSTAKPSLCSRL